MTTKNLNRWRSAHDERAALIRRVKALQSAAQISKEAHVDNVAELTQGRHTSCTSMSPGELRALVARYRKMAPDENLSPQLKLIYSLWLKLKYNNKINNGSRQACRKFCKNQIKALRGRDLPDAPDAWSKVIETLKAMVKETKSPTIEQLIKDLSRHAETAIPAAAKLRQVLSVLKAQNDTSQHQKVASALAEYERKEHGGVVHG